MRGEAVEDYLKSIYRLSQGEDDALEHSSEGRVTTQELAQDMGVTPASASRMLRTLARMSLVEHELYHGARLTPEGEKAALEVIRHHRLLELYLHEVLGYSWDEVHAEAERLEHYISEDFEARIYEALGRPVLDPHGEVIPTAEGEVPAELGEGAARAQPLSEVEEGTSAVVRQVPSAEPEKLRYLSEVGLVPGAEVLVQEKYPYGAGLKLRTADGGEPVIAVELAREIKVTDPEARAAEPSS